MKSFFNSKLKNNLWMGFVDPTSTVDIEKVIHKEQMSEPSNSVQCKLCVFNFFSEISVIFQYETNLPSVSVVDSQTDPTRFHSLQLYIHQFFRTFFIYF